MVKVDVVQVEVWFKVIWVEQGCVVFYVLFDGIVVKIVGELGEYLMFLLFGVLILLVIDLIDDFCFYVKVLMDEVDVLKIKFGQLVCIIFDVLFGQMLLGKVWCVVLYVLVVEKQVWIVDIEVDFEQLEVIGKFLVGYSVDVEIIFSGCDKVLCILIVVIQEGGCVLFFNVESGKLEECKVKIGLINWEYFEVFEGLVVGDCIVILFEKEGVKVGVVVMLDDIVKVR